MRFELLRVIAGEKLVEKMVNDQIVNKKDRVCGLFITYRRERATTAHTSHVPS